MPAEAIQERVKQAVKHMCNGNAKWASELTEQISEVLTSDHPKAVVGWDDGTEHVLYANLSYDDHKGNELRCTAQDATWGEDGGVGRRNVTVS